MTHHPDAKTERAVRQQVAKTGIARAENGRSIVHMLIISTVTVGRKM